MATKERHHRLLCDGLSTVLTENRFCDFEIRTADGSSLSCHRVIMSAVSPFFERMLDTEMQEVQTGCVDLPFDSTTVTNILSYIYKGENVVNTDTVADIYYAANYLDISSLKTDCEEYLRGDLPARVSIEIFQIAKMFDNQDIWEIAKSKVLQDFPLVCNTDCMSVPSLSNMKELLLDPYLNCTGTLKCRAAWLWVCAHDVTKDDVEQIVQSLVNAENVGNDDILCACANEIGDELDKDGDDLLSTQEMWTNVCDKLWIKPDSLERPKLALLPSYDRSFGHFNDCLVFLDEDKQGKTRLTVFDYRKKKWFKVNTNSLSELGYRYAACSDGGMLYISGGHVKYGNQKRFLRLAGDRMECSNLEDMPVGRESHTMAIIGRNLYVIAGVSNDVEYPDDVHKFSLEDGGWSLCGAMALPVSQHSSVTVGNKIYLFGGCTKESKRTPTDTAQYYDTSCHISAILHIGLKVNCKSLTASMTVARDNIYFLFKGEVHRFDPKTGGHKLSEQPIDGAPRRGFVFVAFDGKILIFGGEDDSFKTVKAVIQYDCETNKAVTLPLNSPWPLQDFTCLKMNVPLSWSLEDL